MEGKYQLVYAISVDELIGYRVTVFAVLFNEKGVYTYSFQKVYEQTLHDFNIEPSPVYSKIFQLINELQNQELEKKFNKGAKRIVPLEKLMANAEVKGLVMQYVETKLTKILDLIEENKLMVSLQLNKQEHAAKNLLEVEPEKLEPEFIFDRTELGIHYSLRFKYNNKPLKLDKETTFIVTDQPGRVIYENKLFKLSDEINGNKLKPFLTSDKIFIPKKVERNYFEKFILKTIARFDVDATGFDVQNIGVEPIMQISVEHNMMHNQMAFSIAFKYGKMLFNANDKRTERLEPEFNDNDEVIIRKHNRNLELESKLLDHIEKNNLKPLQGSFYCLENWEKEDHSLSNCLSWAIEKVAAWKNKNIELKPFVHTEGAVVMSIPELELKLKKEDEFYELSGGAKIEKQTVSVAKLHYAISRGKNVFQLADGKVMFIPDEWVAKFKDAFLLATVVKENLRFLKSQYSILEHLFPEHSGKKLRGEAQASALPNPSAELKATLRPYQKEGFHWMVNLYNNALGGCLADDMGLGKTLQTIAVLLYAKENLGVRTTTTTNEPAQGQLDIFSSFQQEIQSLGRLRALIVLPTSLIYNWQLEINRFAPHLKVYIHNGTHRTKNVTNFQLFDVILTSYHLVRNDLEMLKKVAFEYVILDESQQIKNQESKIFKAVNQLDTRHKLSLSGTPIENSLSDLWSQMSFINPNILGTFNFFKKEFILPIEKFDNENKKAQLKLLISPFVLRRTKEEVAKDLPELSEQVYYCSMSPAQRDAYEQELDKTKSFVSENRSQLHKPKVNFQVLNSLLRLRQIANHPVLSEQDYTQDSGKFEDICYHLNQAIKSNHKVLLFSQFVKHLDLFSDYLKSQGISFTYLTGSLNAEERQRQIEKFRADAGIQVFLISIKAGGAGLNLTEADYVFLADPWWNPSVEKQAIARAHRIGQDKKVMAIRFITKGTVEERIIELQEKKLKLAEDLIDGIENVALSHEDIDYLLN